MTDPGSGVAGRSSPAHRALAVFAGLNAISAWGGAIALTVGAIDFGETINSRLPLDSLVLAGAALAVVVAIPCSVLAWAAWVNRPEVPELAMAVGVALVGWIVVQVIVIQSFSWFQPTYVVIGGIIWFAGYRLRDTTEPA